jgi:TonB family protein
VPYTRTLHRRVRRKEGRRLRLALALVGAFLAHGVFVAFLLFLSVIQVTVPRRSGPRHSPSAVSMRPMSSQDWAKNRGADAPPDSRTARAQRAKKEEEKRKKAADPSPPGQVVDVAPGNGQEDPNAKYLAESANKAQKQTKAKDQTAFYRNAMPQRTTNTPQAGMGKDDVKEPQIAGNNGLADDDRPLRDPSDRKATFEVPDVQRREEIALKTAPDTSGIGAAIPNHAERQAIQGNSSRLNITPGGEAGDDGASQGKRGAPGLRTLLPSEAIIGKIMGAAPNDHLEDVEQGDGTYLSTREWKFASFFNRVKQSIGMHWDPSSSLRKRDPTGSMFGGKDRYTMVNVTLSPDGRVADIYVEKSCGLDFLDLEAVKSFERAQPFPNPPPGLLSTDSKIRFSFGFFVDMGGGPRMRLFRQAN